MGPFHFAEPGVSHAERERILYWLGRQEPGRLVQILNNCRVVIHWWKMEADLRNMLVAMNLQNTGITISDFPEKLDGKE